MPRSPQAPLRILHAPRNIAGQAGDTVAALRRLGHQAEVWEDRHDAFGRPADRVFGTNLDAGAVWALVEEAAERFDVIHFHFARTLAAPTVRGLPPFWDLPAYRALGRKVFFTFHGSDIRIERIFRQANPWAVHIPPVDPAIDEQIEQSIPVMRAYADRLFLTSVNMFDFVPDGEYLPRVIDLAAWPEVPPEQHERAIVVHAPTRRARKGTDLILAALEALRAEGLEFELRLLEGVSHDRIRDELLAADVLVDNVVAGSYGVVSLEAMACNRVAVANLSPAVQRTHPDAPVVVVDPDTFQPTMRRLLADRDARMAIAGRGRAYVEAVHDAERVAERLVAAYREPAAPMPATPDWVPPRRPRSTGALEARVARLEAELARARRHELDLRARLGLGPERPSAARRVVRAVLPPAVRTRLRRTLRQP
jgi:glycosyltransferase involved in cell wall biosynthesis